MFLLKYTKLSRACRMGWPCDSYSANTNTPVLDIDGLLASNLLWKLDAMRMTYGQDKLVMKWAYSPIMSHLSSFQNANLRAFYCVWFNSHIAYLVRNWHFLSSQFLLHRWVAWFKSHLHSRGDHFLLYFAYTCVRDLFIGGGIYLAKKIIR
jgi:hypothetical protein